MAELTERLRQSNEGFLNPLRVEAADALDAAHERIEALEAERDRLSVEIDRQISGTVDALAERDAALAEVATLREALRGMLDAIHDRSIRDSAGIHAVAVLDGSSIEGADQ